MGMFINMALVDLSHRGNLGYLIYVVYYINDQVNRLLFEMEERFKGTPYYRHYSNRILKQIMKECQRAKESMYKESQDYALDTADKLVRLEEAFLPYFEVILDKVRLILLDKGVKGDTLDFVISVYGLMILGRCSQDTVEHIQHLAHKCIAPTFTPMQRDNLGKVFVDSILLLKHWLGKELTDQLLEGSPELNEAIRSFSDKIFNRPELCELLLTD